MRRPSLMELEHHCQKPDHRRVGNWMARHISRPAALGVTWLVLPWGIRAHSVTCLAWFCGAAAAAAFAWGSVWGWLIAASLLQLWYLLDHVDGQLARYQGAASLDGTQLDYLMHHTINLLVPLGVGFGLHSGGLEPLWLFAGLAWGLGLLALGLQHDARYKAFMQRLKRVQGELRAIGGGGARPRPTPPIPHRPLRLAAWLVRKACETHVIMNVLSALALAQWWLGDVRLLAARMYILLAAPAALALAVATLARSLRRGAAEEEFTAWYRVPDGHELWFEDGWWKVRPSESGACAENREAGVNSSDQSS